MIGRPASRPGADGWRVRWLACAALAGALALVAMPGVAAAKDKPVPRGYFDRQVFLDLLPNEDAIRVEVSIHKSLINLICSGLEPPLKRIVCGLESIESLVLDVRGQTRERVGQLVPDIDRQLRESGWERIVLVRESSEQVRVLIFNDEEAIRGLVVMVIDDYEMVFVNIAGLIDLQAIQQLAGEFDIPGLEHLEDLERYEERDGKDE